MIVATDEFRLPDLGEGLSEAEIVRWHVGVGDRVVVDQPLVSVETDKAVVEVPSPRSGHVARLCGERGDRIAVGDLLVEFAESTEDRGTVVGRLETSNSKLKASPAVRKLARERGVELRDVTATGPEGTISTADVEHAAGGSGEDRSQQLRGVRRAMAERMANAHRRAVPATLTGEVDIDAWRAAARPLFRLARAVARACAAEPHLNAAFDDARYRLTLHDTVNLGIAMDTEDGLFVPVLTDAANRDLQSIETGISRLEDAVRKRTIEPADLRGQSITLSNFGAMGGLHASMVVVPPQVAIVGAGHIVERVVMADDTPTVHRILPLSLTVDHRVITGAEACRFLDALTEDLQSPD